MDLGNINTNAQHQQNIPVVQPVRLWRTQAKRFAYQKTNTMRTKNIIFFSLVITIFSCSKEVENIESSIDGNYIGIFERNGTTSNVELTFRNGTWSGESEIVKFPALCNGSYSSSGNVLTIENACVWTAEFDWSLILSGDWNYNMNGKTLFLKNASGDTYTLTKQ